MTTRNNARRRCPTCGLRLLYRQTCETCQLFADLARALLDGLLP